MGLGTRHEPDRGGWAPRLRARGCCSPRWSRGSQGLRNLGGKPGDLVPVAASWTPLEMRSRGALAPVLLLPWGLSGARQAVQLKVLQAWVAESVFRLKSASLPCSSRWRTLNAAFSPPPPSIGPLSCDVGDTNTCPVGVESGVHDRT